MKVIRWPYGGNKEQGELGRSVLHGLLYGNYIGIATDVNDHPTFFFFFSVEIDSELENTGKFNGALFSLSRYS